MNQNVLRASEGMKVRGNNGQPVTIQPKCSTDRGFWFCVTHREQFANQFEKDSHIHGNSKHVLAWFCLEHGQLEVP